MIVNAVKLTIIVAILFFGLAACASKPLDLNGVDGSPVPPAFANFPDIPFPEKAFLELGDTKDLGSGDNWLGSLVFTAPYNASRVFDFYVLEMPRNRWTEIAVVRARISQMTYFRDKRAIQILIESIGDNDSRVTITAIPNEAALQ